MAASEVDTTERPVREQLRNATLEHEHSPTAKSQVNTTPPPEAKEVDAMRGRKRSFDGSGRNHATPKPDLDDSSEKTDGNSDVRPTTQEAQPETSDKEIKADEVGSPRTKRSRLQGTGTASDTLAKLAPGSGFADTSAASPFGAVKTETSSGAFASSKFSAFANKTSAFGNANKTESLSSFASKPADSASSEPSSSDKIEASTKSIFGGALGAKSAFSGSSNGANNGSVFGKSTAGGGLGGSAFGSLSQGPGLSSFGSGKSTPAAKPLKQSSAAGEDGEDDAEEGIKSPLSADAEEKTDERFYEQEVETGEENEAVVFSSRAKLYTWATNEAGKKEWKERGLGVLKLNKKKDESDDGLIQPSSDAADSIATTTTTATTKQPNARFLMRADGSHRVVLNTPIKKEIKVASASGGPPVNGYLLFMGTIDGNSKLELLQIKLKQQHALELYNKVIELQEET